MTATIATVPALSVETAALDTVEFDIYRDVHKGIRLGLFGVTMAAGSVDASDRAAVAAVADRWRNLVGLLVSHAEHEDRFVQPLLECYEPVMAAVVAQAHPELEATMAALELVADRAAGACRENARLATHRLYLGLASFTASYIEHQEFEELHVMPALSARIGADELRAVDEAIVASIPPEEMVQDLSIMLPAMNVDDRVEMFGAMRAGAPPEVVEQVLGLARSVLDPAAFDATATRLGI